MKSQGPSRVELEQERGVGRVSQNEYNNIIREIVKYFLRPGRQLGVECGKRADFRIYFYEGRN